MRIASLKLRLAVSTLAVALASTVPALAESVVFKAALNGASEVPPNDSTGTGAVEATLDTSAKTLGWTITYSGISGDATAAHFHGPAAEGANAGPVVPIEGTLASPIKGTSTLSDDQIKDLQAGMWYFNVHSAKFPDGEIRGQLKK